MSEMEFTPTPLVIVPKHGLLTRVFMNFIRPTTMDNQKCSHDAGRPNNFPRCSGGGFPLHIPGAADKKRARAVHYITGQNCWIEVAWIRGCNSDTELKYFCTPCTCNRERRKESDWSNSSRTPIPLFLSMKSVAICRGIKRNMGRCFARSWDVQ